MNPKTANATETKSLLLPADHANTAAASTSTGVDVTAYEGAIVVTEHVGVVTAGTLDGKLVTGDESDLSDATDISGATFVQRGTATDNIVESIVIDANNCKQYLGYVGTIATGPAVVGVSFVATKKYA